MSTTTLSFVAVCGQAEPGGLLYVAGRSETGRYETRRFLPGEREGRDPLPILQAAVKGDANTLKSLFGGYGCQPGCHHPDMPHSGTSNQPYRALVSARYIRRGTVMLDFHHPVVSPQAIEQLQERLAPYAGLEGAEVKAVVAQLDYELGETYRLALDAAAQTQRLLVASNAESDQATLQHIATWSEQIRACNARLTEDLDLRG